MINLHHQDCMAALAQMPDNAFDLAIVDPPYGIGYDSACAKNNGVKFGGVLKQKRVFTTLMVGIIKHLQKFTLINYLGFPKTK